MKKVWILEKFIGPEEMAKTMGDLNELLNIWTAEGNAEYIETMQKVIKANEEKHAANPDGYWSGWQGKTNYRQFCDFALESIRLSKRNKDGAKFRVVKAEIDDDATTWNGYRNGIENPGVLRYLYAVA